MQKLVTLKNVGVLTGVGYVITAAEKRKLAEELLRENSRLSVDDAMRQANEILEARSRG